MEKTKNNISDSLSFKKEQYLSFAGLTHNPFPMAPDDTDFFISDAIEKIIQEIVQSILLKKGFMLLTGEIGLGKTTLTRRIISILETKNVEISLILQAFYQENELLVAINRDFGIIHDDLSMTRQMELLNQFLLEKNQEGVNCAIVIDDAQSLTFKSLELIRMISNLEADQEKLVQVLLVGQTELMEKMQSHKLRQLKSRVVVWKKPVPLNQSEIVRYIQFKMNKAGDTGRIKIKKNALAKLYKLSGGNIRRVNVIMDRALSQAFAKKTLTIKKQFINDVFESSPKELIKATRPYSSALVLSLCVLLVGWVIGGAAFYYYKIKPSRVLVTQPKSDIVQKKTISTTPTKQPGAEPVIDSGTPLASVSLTNSKQLKKTSNKVNYQPVELFLKANNLSYFKNEFTAFLEKGNLTEFRNQVFNKTGKKLIVLSFLPRYIQQKYDILSITHQGQTSPTYYLFWKQTMEIENFYYGYKNREVIPLQKLLKNIDLYDYQIDGIAGAILIKGLTRFQKQNKLEVTGFPDVETLFLLNHIQQ